MTAYERGRATLTREDEVWVLTLTGEHDVATAPELEHEMEQIEASGTSVVIDLTEASFIDSQVIAWLLRWSKRAASSTHLRLAVATGGDGSIAKRLIDLVGIADHLPCHRAKAEAVAHLSSMAPA
jgi:anti-anti-sigma factor